VSEHETHYVGVLEENLAALATVIARQVIQRDVMLDPSSHPCARAGRARAVPAGDESARAFESR
jgi:hypothetical protein